MPGCFLTTLAIKSYPLTVLLAGQAKVLYDFAQEAPSKFAFTRALMLTIVIFDVIFFYLAWRYRNKIARRYAFLLVIVGWGSLGCIGGGIGSSVNYLKYKDIYDHRAYHIVEGKVNNLRNIKVKSAEYEEFEVNDVSFWLHGYDSPDHYVYDQKHVVQNEMNLKIYYFNYYNQNMILHIEIEPS